MNRDYAAEREERRQKIIKDAKARKRKRLYMKVAFVAAFIVGVLIAATLAGLVFQIAWNVGVVGLVAAAGGSVAKISLGTALGGILVLMFLQGVLGKSNAGTAATTVVNNSRKG